MSDQVAPYELSVAPSPLETFLPVARDNESVSMLRGLSARETQTREDTVSQCLTMFHTWYLGLGSPPTQSGLRCYLDDSVACGNGVGGDPAMRPLIEEQLPDLLRLARTAPLRDVRDKAAKLLDFVEDRLQMRLPRPRHRAEAAVSEFIPQSELVPLLLDQHQQQQPNSRRASIDWDDVDSKDNEAADNADEDAVVVAVVGGGQRNGGSSDADSDIARRSRELLLDHFHDWHRTCHVFRVMAYHPEYLDAFLACHNSLLLDDGPIGLAERHYLAVLAAARHRCSYLVHLHAIEFVHANGDPAWLRGLRQAPAKMRKLAGLAKLLAHRPWELTPDALRPLLSGPVSLSQSELVQAMCILAHFAALAGFVAGTGVRPELDSPLGHSYRSESGSSEQQLLPQQHIHSVNGGCAARSSPASEPSDPKQCVLDLMNAMKDIDDVADAAQQLPEEQLQQRFERLEQENAAIGVFRSLSREQQEERQQQQRQDEANAELENFCDEPSYRHKDFHLAKAANKQLRSFRIQEYSWESHGSCLVERFLNSIGCQLDERFNKSFSLTYDTMGGHRGVQTAPFRYAVWYFVHSIFGMRHDDFDYSLIGVMLSVELRNYCKLVACHPELVTQANYQLAMPGFRHSEKVHVNLLIMDARVQATMLYGLRALNDHATGQ